MNIRITWWAKSCLKEIHKYYTKEASQNKATEIVDQIIKAALSLNRLPQRGRVEEDLRVLNKGHRYILEGHFKIIYRIEGDTVYITDIFNNWQNPESKIKRNS